MFFEFSIYISSSEFTNVIIFFVEVLLFLLRLYISLGIKSLVCSISVSCVISVNIQKSHGG